MSAGPRRASMARAAARPAPRRRRVVYDAVTFSEHEGLRFLHFGTEWVQGAMFLKKPDLLALEYARQMMAFLLFVPAPRQVAQLGLGAASLTKFCYRALDGCAVTAVELDPALIAAARTMFKLPPDDERLTVLEMDALAFVTDAARHGQFDALQIDLYDASARGPVLDTEEFYAAGRACLAPHGLATVNLFGEHASFPRNLRALEVAYAGRVLVLPALPEGNRIALAFAGPLDVGFDQLHERAARLEGPTGLRAREWVEGLHAAWLARGSRGPRGRLVL